ncbi:MAG: ABC transporter permease [Candidatus Latescibacteria bacterium]|nr:ABC transporter permease [Candidatus Latescibacterota bacterium]
MIFWKEWRSLQGRFFTLGGFYIISALLIDIRFFGGPFTFAFVPTWIISWGSGMLLVPAILGMDAYVGERDEGTEDFLFSKPIPVSRLILSKIGLRFLLTLIVTGATLSILLIRTSGMVSSLYLGTRPFIVFYITFTVILAQLVVLMITIVVSLRAPYQSTALIIGGTLGTAVAAFPVLNKAGMMQALQAPWGNFWIILILLILTAGIACWGLTRQEVGRSLP